jgi:hypothetical protein
VQEQDDDRHYAQSLSDRASGFRVVLFERRDGGFRCDLEAEPAVRYAFRGMWMTWGEGGWFLPEKNRLGLAPLYRQSPAIEEADNKKPILKF